MASIALNSENDKDLFQGYVDYVKGYFSKEGTEKRALARSTRMWDKLLLKFDDFKSDANLDITDIRFMDFLTSILLIPLEKIVQEIHEDGGELTAFDQHVIDNYQYVLKYSEALNHVLESNMMFSMEEAFNIIDEMEDVREEYQEITEEWKFANLDCA